MKPLYITYRKKSNKSTHLPLAVCSCPECGQEHNDEYESCYKLYHLNCTTLQSNDNLKEIDFNCNP